MRVLNTISFPLENGLKNVQFGIPDNEHELDLMYALRYEVYINEKKYISSDEYKSGYDIDQHDQLNECLYFIAKVDDNVIGTARVITSNPLPIFKDYFQFSEPKQLVHMDQSKKIEIGRIISRHMHLKNLSIPFRLIMLGIFTTIAQYSKEAGFEAGYGAMKQSAFDKYKKIGFPLYKIKKYKLIFESANSDDPLKNFFNKDDPPVPVYYLREQAQEYGDAFFSNKALFTQISPHNYVFRNKRLTIFDKIGLWFMTTKLRFKFSGLL